MTTDAILQLVMSGGSGMAGVLMAFVVLRIQVRRNTKDIKHLRKDVDQITGAPTGEPVYVRRDECAKQTKQMAVEISTVSSKVDGLQRYARHQLTKDGMTLDKVNEILGDH